MRYCSYCGNPLHNSSAPCPICGKRHTGASPEIVESKSTRRFWGVVIGIVVITLAAALCFYLTKNPFSTLKRNPAGSGEEVKETAAVADIVPDEPVSIPDLAQSVLYLEGYDGNDEFLKSASGFFIDDNILVTNYHVIEDVHRLFAFTSDDSESAEFDVLLAYDEEIDLAILSSSGKLNADVFSLANSDTVRQGDKVYAIGYPLGLANTLTEGIVGAVYDMETYELIQISAPISQGNSGGAVLNEAGEVIGVACMYLLDGQNLNYAIASNDVKKLYEASESGIQLAEFYSDNGNGRITQVQEAAAEPVRESEPEPEEPPKDTPKQEQTDTEAPSKDTPRPEQTDKPKENLPQKSEVTQSDQGDREPEASSAAAAPTLSLSPFQGVWSVVSTKEWQLSKYYIDISTMGLYWTDEPGYVRGPAPLVISDDGTGLVRFPGASAESFIYIDSNGLLVEKFTLDGNITVMQKESGRKLDVSILQARGNDYDSNLGFDGAEID